MYIYVYLTTSRPLCLFSECCKNTIMMWDFAFICFKTPVINLIFSATSYTVVCNLESNMISCKNIACALFLGGMDFASFVWPSSNSNNNFAPYIFSKNHVRIACDHIRACMTHIIMTYNPGGQARILTCIVISLAPPSSSFAIIGFAAIALIK